jgi:hypothetical protein
VIYHNGEAGVLECWNIGSVEKWRISLRFVSIPSIQYSSSPLVDALVASIETRKLFVDRPCAGVEGMPEDGSVAEQLDRVRRSVDWLSSDVIKYALIAVVALIFLYIVYKILTRRKKETVRRAVDQGVDIASLGSDGPPAAAAELEFYNLPVRLAAVVLAPAGRVRDLPPPNEMDELFDAIVPELSKVVATHKPLIRRWSPQLSVKGFALVVFQRCRLPGDTGKGTPWSTTAGVFELEGQPMMAALIVRSVSDNSHGQRVIDQPHEWLNGLRVKA